MSPKLPFEKKRRKILQIRGEQTEPYQPTMADLLHQSILNINKPKGPTSHQVADWTKKILKVQKAGQAGTLDPGVTGVLPIGIGNATKVLQVLLNAGKEYVCSMHIHDDKDPKFIEKTLNSFEGRIKQLPPIKSAVKRQWRYRKIYYIQLLEVQGREVLFKVGCQAGTYIRKLCSDLGDALGCGAHMAQLVRTKSGPFQLLQSTTLQDLTDAFHVFEQYQDDRKIKTILQPIENMVQHLPKIWVEDQYIPNLINGVQVQVSMITHLNTQITQEDIVAVMSQDSRLILFGQALKTTNQVADQKGKAVKTMRVVMEQAHKQV